MSIERRTLQDVGTRYDHLQELKDNWNFSIRVLEDHNYSEHTKLQITALKNGVRLVDATLDGLAEYREKEFILAREIDRIKTEKDLFPKEGDKCKT